MFTSTQIATLDAFAQTVVPPGPGWDNRPSRGAGDLNPSAFVGQLLQNERAADRAEIVAFLDTLESAHDFAHLSADDRVATLAGHETTRAFRILAELIHEFYWTHPEGFASVGFVVTG